MTRNLKCPTTGKSVYFTEEAAAKAAIHCQGKRQVVLRTYHCPDCHTLHLTKARQWPPAQRTAAEMFKGLLNKIKGL